MSYYSLYLLLGHLIVSVSSCTRGDVRLEDGSTRFEGRVEVCIDGGWRIICDNFWDPPDAKVVCRQLGFLEISLRNETINAHVTGERFGRGPSRSINSVECRSNDERLLECNYSTISPPTCLSAGVRCMEGASPTNLSYFKRDTNVVLTWSPTNISTADTSIDPLAHYTATCITDTDENYQHLSQVLVNMNTLSTTISGLNLMDFDYNCCVSADYGSYHPKTCLRVNKRNFPITTVLRITTHNPTSIKPTSEVVTISLSPSSDRSPHVVGGILGTIIVIQLIIIICGIIFYFYLLKSKTKSNIKVLENPMYACRATPTSDNEEQDFTIAYNILGHAYEPVDVAETNDITRSTMATRYEFAEIHSPIKEPGNRRQLPTGRYEFAETSVQQLNTPLEYEIPSSTENLASMEEDSKDPAKWSLYPKDTLESRYTYMHLDTTNTRSTHDYSHIHVADTEHHRRHSHVDNKDRSHSYSHISTTDGKLSSGYFHLDTGELAAEKGCNAPPVVKTGHIKGYSHLDITESANSETERNIQNLPATTNGVPKGYSHLDIPEIQVTDPGHSHLNRMETNQEDVSKGYSHLDIAENQDRYVTKTGGNYYERETKGGYSSLNIEENK